MITAFRPRCGDRCVRISELEGKRVAIWGYGREGRAALAALRWRLPRQPVHRVLQRRRGRRRCARWRIRALVHRHRPVDAAARSLRFDVVIKSPGISPYASPVADAQLHGVRFIGGTRAVVRREPAASARVCVTGTKGKSTTTALIAHLLRAAGQRTALAGNIGLPLLELLDVRAAAATSGRSSCPATRPAKAVRPDVAVVLNLFPEHLDWHGTEARYFDDKLALVTHAAPRVAVLNAADPTLARPATRRRARGAVVQPRRRLAPARRRAVCRGGRRVLDAARAAAAGPPQPPQPVRGAGRDRGAGHRRRGAGAGGGRPSSRCRIGCSRWARATASSSSTIPSAPRRTPASPRSTATAAAASPSWWAATTAAWTGASSPNAWPPSRRRR